MYKLKYLYRSTDINTNISLSHTDIKLGFNYIYGYNKGDKPITQIIPNVP